MKTCLIIQLRPEDETADNEFEAILKYSELKENEVTRLRAEKTGLGQIDLSDHFAIIVGGSPFDVSTPEAEKNTIQKQIEQEFTTLFAEVIKQDFPFLGACSGNGQLGKYLGGHISRKYPEPVGGTDIFITPAGQQDKLLVGFPEKIRVLLGHKEACDETPPKAVLLATNEACPVQMFRVGENVYSTQFHPEADPKGFITRINIYKHHGYFPANTASELINLVKDEHTPEAQEILRRFISHYRPDTLN